MRIKDDERWQWLNNEHGDLILGLLTVFAFPLGLTIMWTESRWPTYRKVLISAAWALILCFGIYIAVTTTLGYEESIASYTVVDNTGRMMGPLQPEHVTYIGQSFKNSDVQSRLISEPTPTPVPTMVYCNDNGVNYHLAGCRYVYEKTPRVTLTQALNAGKTACKLCNPPKEETYEND